MFRRKRVQNVLAGDNLHRPQSITISRALAEELTKLFEQDPVVTLTGPRQSGETALAGTLEYYER